MEQIKNAIQKASQAEFGVDVAPEFTRPDEKFGDWSSNVAMQLGKKTSRNPREIAILLASKLHKLPEVEKVEVADPGFINVWLKDEILYKLAIDATDLPKPNAGKEILVEFGDPNPFKELHIGHLYSAVTGDAVASLLENSGADVKRLSYHGDVGLHVAKAIWAMKKDSGNTEKDLGEYYVQGAAAFEKDKETEAEIHEINQRIYAKDDPAINRLHQQGIAQSFKYFDQVFGQLGIKYEPNGRYLESAATDVGAKIVKGNIGKVFEKSEGAVVYKGEKAGLHTRVFITSKGLPTYETKDLGLVELKAKDYPKADKSIIITAHEQSEYFKVMLAALAEINPQLAGKTTHLYHGFVSLSTGKMSSRSGEVYAASSLLEKVKAEVAKRYPDSKTTEPTFIGAVKYALLKHRLGPDIIFDVEESVSLEGNSGPYLQYAYARACSILDKSKASNKQLTVSSLEKAERSLALKTTQYPEIVTKATAELQPSQICTYLYELAQTFNSFYETSRIIGDKREDMRLQLVAGYSKVLKRGLNLLNISAPERI